MSRFVLVLVLIAAGAHVALAQDPAAIAAVRVLAGVNASQSDARRALVDSALAAQPDSVRAEAALLLDRLHADGAPFTLDSARTMGRDVFVWIRSTRAGRVALIDAGHAAADPGHWHSLELLEAHATLAERVAWPAVAPVRDEALATLIERNVRLLADAGSFSGTVFVSVHGKPIVARGYGLADRDHGVPDGMRTRFHIASIGKMFTATAIAQLVEAGKLRWDDTLANVLPEYPNADRARRITIRELLAHTAGLGDVWSTEKHPVSGKYSGQLATLAPIAWAPLAFEPGAQWQYSNEGFVTLGAVIEKVSGDSFADYLARHIFASAGMIDVSIAALEEVVPNRAIGYRAADDDVLGVRTPRANWSFFTSTTTGPANGAGGEYATAADLARFADALLGGRLVSRATLDTLWAARNRIPWRPDLDESYGYGAMTWRIGDHTVIGHGGGGGGSGIDDEFRFDRDGAFTVVVLANVDPPAGSRLGEALVRLLASRSVVAAKGSGRSVTGTAKPE